MRVRAVDGTEVNTVRSLEHGGAGDSVTVKTSFHFGFLLSCLCNTSIPVPADTHNQKQDKLFSLTGDDESLTDSYSVCVEQLLKVGDAAPPTQTLS